MIIGDIFGIGYVCISSHRGLGVWYLKNCCAIDSCSHLRSPSKIPAMSGKMEDVLLVSASAELMEYRPQAEEVVGDAFVRLRPTD